MMPGYQYRAPRHPMLTLTITPEQEASIEADLARRPLVRITNHDVGLTGGWTGAEPKPCGTNAAYTRHRNHSEAPCQACKDAHAAFVRFGEEKRRIQPCGTNAAYKRHFTKGERPCKPCKEAHAAYMRNSESRQRTRPLKPCGTIAAHRRHLRHGEPPCKACKAAMNAYKASRQSQAGQVAA